MEHFTRSQELSRKSVSLRLNHFIAGLCIWMHYKVPELMSHVEALPVVITHSRVQNNERDPATEHRIGIQGRMLKGRKDNTDPMILNRPENMSDGVAP